MSGDISCKSWQRCVEQRIKIELRKEEVSVDSAKKRYYLSVGKERVIIPKKLVIRDMYIKIVVHTNVSAHLSGTDKGYQLNEQN